jgi:hypothetical protein
LRILTFWRVWGPGFPDERLPTRRAWNISSIIVWRTLSGRSSTS